VWRDIRLSPLQKFGATGATFPALRKDHLPYTLSSMESETLRNLYPELTEGERSEAAENLDRYLTIAWEIYDDLQADNQQL
jgi:hypothetical protein